MTQADFWKTHPKQSIYSKNIFRDFRGVTQTVLHPYLDAFSKNRWKFRKKIWMSIPGFADKGSEMTSADIRTRPQISIDLTNFLA